MDVEVLKAVGKVAGIGGLALGVFLIIFREVIRKQIFAQLGQSHSYRIIRLALVLTFLLAVMGLAAWIYADRAHVPGSVPPTKRVWTELRLRDDFSDGLADGWTWVRED